MPRIPQYTSQEGIGTSPQSQINVSDYVESSGGKELKQAGEQLSDLGTKIQGIQNANEESNAKLASLKFEEEYTSKIDNEPNTAKALENIENDTRKSRDTIANTISDPVFRQQWIQKQELSDQVFIINQRAREAKRVISEGKVTLLRDLELEKSKYRNSQTEEEKISAQEAIHAKIYDPKLQPLFKDEEEKYKLEEDTIKQAQDDLKDVESLRRVKEKEFKLAQEAAVNQRENEFIKMKITGTDKLGGSITKDDLIIMAKHDMQSGDISPTFADRYINALKSPKAVKAKTIDKDFAKVITAINEGDMNFQEIRMSMLEGVSNGNLSENDFSNASIYMDILGEKNVEDLVSEGRRGFWSSISNWAGNIKSKDLEAESKARMSRNYINKLQSGIEANQAAIESIREETLRLQPDAINFSEGMVVIDNDGRTKKIMPNGDLLEIESKGKKQ